DADAAWTNVHVSDHPVTTVAPDDNVAARLGGTPGRIVVNLATKGALDAIAALREAGVTTPTFGCIADVAAGPALPPGGVDGGPPLLDPDMVLGALAGQQARTTRVVTVGDDVDAFVSLRQALAREGMSVSMAWNAKQAAELLPMVRPTVVVLDLDLPGRDGAGIVAQVGACEPIPTLVLIAPSADSAASFAAVLADASHAQRAIALPALLASVVRPR